jgi:hypothetical protein
VRDAESTPGSQSRENIVSSWRLVDRGDPITGVKDKATFRESSFEADSITDVGVEIGNVKQHGLDGVVRPDSNAISKESFDAWPRS